jgi:predicted PurR-regulated permease PerM
VLLALLAGAHLAGLIGALVAVPLLAAAWEIVRRVYIERDDMRLVDSFGVSRSVE